MSEPDVTSARSGLYPGAALGYRVWSLEEGGLRSIGIGASEWEPATQAVCLHHPHSAPQELCECGLYALHSLKQAVREFYLYLALRESGSARGGPLVVGAIAGSGRIRVHPTGWRAERAQVLGLLSSGERVRAAARRYGVPEFTGARELEAHASSLAAPVARELIPEQTSGARSSAR